MPLRYSLLALALVVALAAGPSPHALAIDFPSATYSVIPAGIVVCPAGDASLTMRIMDLYNNPVQRIQVDLEFAACPGVAVCDECCSGETLDRVNRIVSKVTDDVGLVSFGLEMGGVCSGQLVTVRCGGWVLRRLPVASPDQDGNFYVGTHDLDLITPRLGTQDPTADFNLDGWVTQADLDWMFPGHAGHSCTGGVVGTARHTWGTLKVLYR